MCKERKTANFKRWQITCGGKIGASERAYKVDRSSDTPSSSEKSQPNGALAKSQPNGGLNGHHDQSNATSAAVPQSPTDTKDQFFLAPTHPIEKLSEIKLDDTPAPLTSDHQAAANGASSEAINGQLPTVAQAA